MSIRLLREFLNWVMAVSGRFLLVCSLERKTDCRILLEDLDMTSRKSRKRRSLFFSMKVFML